MPPTTHGAADVRCPTTSLDQSTLRRLFKLAPHIAITYLLAGHYTYGEMTDEISPRLFRKQARILQSGSEQLWSTEARGLSKVQVQTESVQLSATTIPI